MMREAGSDRVESGCRLPAACALSRIAYIPKIHLAPLGRARHDLRNEAKGDGSEAGHLEIVALEKGHGVLEVCR